jgi:hypothetical protein
VQCSQARARQRLGIAFQVTLDSVISGLRPIEGCNEVAFVGEAFCSEAGSLS